MSRGGAVIDLGAYDWRPKSPHTKWTCRLGNSTLSFQKQPVLVIVIISAFILLTYFKFSGSSLRSPSIDNTSISEYNHSYPLTEPIRTSNGFQYKIAVIADLDTDSKVTSEKNTWRSYLKIGTLTWKAQSKAVTIDWNEAQEIKSKYSIGGRGMELSELVVFNGHLYTVDDRTGIVFKLKNVENKKWIAIPWVILADGNGEESKGFKCEWMTVKDQHLYVGGLGKEWTTPDGEVLNFNPMFVKKISMHGKVEHLDWHQNYLKLRSKAGIEFPGYMIHEAAMWSNFDQKWTFLPRRAHPDKYNDVDDEKHGTNLMLTTDDQFHQIDLKTVGNLETPTHGFSSFKFIPGTQDSVIVALKSEEMDGRAVATYIMVFRREDGAILLPETKIGDHKYEGIEFI